MIKDSKARDSLSKLGTSTIVKSNIKADLYRLTCLIYGLKDCTDVNHACLKLMEGKASTSLSKLKSFDPASLPPRKQVFDQKIKRVNLVCNIWLNAHKVHIMEWDP